MKKILSAVLVLCMLATLCLSLVACDEISKREVKKDPVGTVSEAFDNAFSQFFGDDAGAEKTLEKAFKKGSVDITLASRSLMGGELTEISETLYMDQKNSAFVSDTKLVYDGHRYKATLWGDKKGLTFQSASVLGSDDAIRLGYDTFEKYFSDSALFDYLHKNLGLSDEDATSVVSVVQNLRGMADSKQAALSEKDMDKLLKQTIEIFQQRVDTEKGEDENGKQANFIVVTYKVDNEKIAEAARLILDTLIEKEVIQSSLGADDLSDRLEDTLTELAWSYNIEADVFVYINTKTNAVSSVEIRADVAPMSAASGARGGDTIMVEATLSFTEKEITLTGKAKAGSTRYTLDAGIEKQTTGNKVTYDAWVSVKAGNVRLDVFEATCTYNKKTGELNLQGTVAMDEYDSVDFAMAATYTADKNEVVFDLESVQIKEDREELFFFGDGDTLRVIIKPLSKLPEPDSDAVDIVTMDEDEVSDLFEGIADSDIAQLVVQLLFGTM